MGDWNVVINGPWDSHYPTMRQHVFSDLFDVDDGFFGFGENIPTAH